MRNREHKSAVHMKTWSSVYNVHDGGTGLEGPMGYDEHETASVRQQCPYGAGRLYVKVLGGSSGAGRDTTTFEDGCTFSRE